MSLLNEQAPAYALTGNPQPSVLPLPELIARINAIWQRKGIKPKQHLSSPCPGAESVMEKRKHADRCYELPPDLPDDMDLMIEVRFPLLLSPPRLYFLVWLLTSALVGQAKDKEQAVLHLYRVYNLHPVIYANLRPEKAAKPFPRMVKEEAAAAAVAAGGESAKATPTLRKRAKRTQAKMEETAGNDAFARMLVLRSLWLTHSLDALAVLETGVTEEPKDLEEAVEIDDTLAAAPKAAVKSPRKRRTKKVTAASMEANDASPADGEDLEEAVEVEDALATVPKVAAKSSRKRRTTKTTAASTEAKEALPAEGEATGSESKPTKKPPAKKRGRKGTLFFETFNVAKKTDLTVVATTTPTAGV